MPTEQAPASHELRARRTSRLWLARTGVRNVRVMRGDGVQILTDLIAPGSLSEAWLFFPDPWPKVSELLRAA